MDDWLFAEKITCFLVGNHGIYFPVNSSGKNVIVGLPKEPDSWSTVILAETTKSQAPIKTQLLVGTKPR
jgi:hypothetical protein